MKKSFFLMALIAFFGSSASNVPAANNNQSSEVSRPNCSSFRSFMLTLGLHANYSGSAKQYRVDWLLFEGAANQDFCLFWWALSHGANPNRPLTSISRMTGNRMAVDKPLIGPALNDKDLPLMTIMSMLRYPRELFAAAERPWFVGTCDQRLIEQMLKAVGAKPSISKSEYELAERARRLSDDLYKASFFNR